VEPVGRNAHQRTPDVIGVGNVQQATCNRFFRMGEGQRRPHEPVLDLPVGGLTMVGGLWKSSGSIMM